MEGSATTQFMAYMETYFSQEKENWDISTSVRHFKEFAYEQIAIDGIYLPVFMGYGKNLNRPCYNDTCLGISVDENFPIVILHHSTNYQG